MKISNSKKQLAKIIHENGGWRGGANWYVQQHTKRVVASEERPVFDDGVWCSRYFFGGFFAERVRAWHQSCLSRAEYFHLYPAPDADGWIEWNGGECPVGRGTLVDVKYADNTINCGVSALTNSAHEDHVFGTCGSMTAANWGAGLPMSGIIAYRLHKPGQAKPEFCDSVMRSIPGPDEQVWTNPQTIEQLATDYRNAKDYADRKQQEADDAQADAEAKLAELVAAGKAHGLVLSVVCAEPELAAAVKVGDEVECVKSNIKRDKYNGMVGRLHTIDESDTSTPYLVDFGGNAKIWCHEVKFIRRPTQGGADA